MDTIVGISTTLGNSGINVVRISGEESTTIISKIFTGKIEDHKIAYGHIKDEEETIDEVLVTFMQGPKSYTKEDVIEINCHGGVIVTKKIVELIVKQGAVLAKAGEFTKRAFLNGRIDLSQAEAIMGIINSKTENEAKVSLNHLQGSLSKEIGYLREDILKLIAEVEASIDYPEHDMEHDNIENIEKSSHNLIEDIKRLINSYNQGKIIKEGIKTVIVGKPNVGKSSLLNKLYGEEKAIVTDIEGTTRDTIDCLVNIKGIMLNLIDTAGIRETEDVIEKIGVVKSKEELEKAELVLMMLDSSKPLSEEDKEIFELIKEKKVIGIINKTDLKRELEEIHLEHTIEMSVKKSFGLNKLHDLISDMFDIGEIEESANLITNIRHKDALEKAVDSLCNVLESINIGMSEDIIAIDLKDAYSYLGEILGEQLEEDIIDKIFSEFCLGK